MKPSRLALVFSLITLTACAGSSGPARRTLPSAELDALELLPRDAYFMGRLDGAALRATPLYEQLTPALENEGVPLRHVAGVDYVYLAVGGLTSTPRIVQTEGDVGEDLAWQPIAELFGGRIPRFAAVLVGRAASVCRDMLSEVETSESQGYLHGSRGGITVAVRGELLCVVTFEPVFRSLLDERGQTPAIASRLAGASEDGGLGIIDVALELESPAFRQLFSHAGELTEQGEEEEDGEITVFMRSMLAAIVRGVSSTHFQIAAREGSYTYSARTYVSDHDRGVMWRELGELYLDIARALLESGWLRSMAGESAQEQLAQILDSTRIEPRNDGFFMRTGISERRVTSIVESIIGEVTRDGYDGTSAFDDERNDSAVSLASRDANEIIEALEPRVDAMLASPTYDDAQKLLLLANAYAFKARFDDAKRLLRRAIDQTNDGVQQVDFTLTLAEILIEAGYAEEALVALARTRERCEDGAYCGERYGEVALLEMVAKTLRGDRDQLRALDDMITTPPSFTLSHFAFARTRARILLHLGRHAEAAASASTACTSIYSAGDECLSLLLLVGMATAMSDASLDDALVSHARARGSRGRSGSTGPGPESESLEVDLIECVLRAKRAPTSREARIACELALGGALQNNGQNHPRTARAALEYARVLTAARSSASSVNEQLERVDAALAALGPSTPLRAMRAAFGARRGR